MEQGKEPKTPKEIMESEEYARKREEIIREVNTARIEVQYDLFEHTKQEKERIMDHKQRNKDARKARYGADANKHLNIPENKITPTIHHTF